MINQTNVCCFCRQNISGLSFSVALGVFFHLPCLSQALENDDNTDAQIIADEVRGWGKDEDAKPHPRQKNP